MGKILRGDDVMAGPSPSQPALALKKDGAADIN
jgi:hypothetical protein